MNIKKIILTCVLFVNCISINAQNKKLAINVDAVKTWSEISNADISRDGNFGYYVVSSPNDQTINVKSIRKKWVREFKGANNPFITGYGKYFLCETDKDSIKIVELGKDKINTFPGTRLVFLNDSSSSLYSWSKGANTVIWNSRNYKFDTLYQVSQSYVSPNGEKMLVVRHLNKIYSIELINLKNFKKAIVWEGSESPQRIIFNSDVSRFTFFSLVGTQYKKNMNIHILDFLGNQVILSNEHIDQSGGYFISNNNLRFSSNGKHLFFSVERKNDTISSHPLVNTARVDVWNYQDKVIQSQQLSDRVQGKQIFMASYNLKNKKARIIPLNDDEIYISDFYAGPFVDIDKYCLIKQKIQKPNEVQFHPRREESKGTIYLFDLYNGKKILCASNGYFTGIRLSPTDKHLLYFDQIEKQYYVYDPSSGLSRNITGNISTSFSSLKREEERNPLSEPAGIAGWSDNGQVLLYDNFDIWSVDLFNIHKAPTNITKGYGRRSNCTLFLSSTSQNDNFQNIYRWGSSVIIKAINRDNYNEGIISVPLNHEIDLHNLVFLPHHYGNIISKGAFYLTGYSRSNTAFNWYITKNFHQYVPLSNVQPQEGWKWFTKELMDYQGLDGEWNKGILYKPEDFDPNKKYPIIFQFYEVLSDKIHEFEYPKLSTGPVRPAWFASHGYLVFQPDIKFKFGNPGDCAYTSVVGAANFLKTKNWVDSTKMGISGGSYGGYSVNYIITRTNIFAAAAEACGVSDIVSSYGETRENGISRIYIYETSQGRIGATLWERPELYISNSPIYSANKVTTPLLILHNKEDDGVPWSQGLAWFISLRRLGKKVFMLQYDGEGHGLSSELSRIDYTKRLDQYFDYLLKGAPAPIWMTRGIRAVDKQIISGLELDSTGRTL